MISKRFSPDFPEILTIGPLVLLSCGQKLDLIRTKNIYRHLETSYISGTGTRTGTDAKNGFVVYYRQQSLKNGFIEVYKFD